MRGKLFVIVKEKAVGAKRVQALLQQHGKTLHIFRNKSWMMTREAYRCMCITCIVPMTKKYRQPHKKPDAEGLNVVDQAPAHHAEDTLRDQYLQEANIKTKEPTDFIHGHAKHDYTERIKKKVGQVDDLWQRTDREKECEWRGEGRDRRGFHRDAGGDVARVRPGLHFLRLL